MQLHKHGRLVRLYTKSGYDCTKRFGGLAEALTKAPARLCIIDSQVVACDTRGLPDLYALPARERGKDQKTSLIRTSNFV